MTLNPPPLKCEKLRRPSIKAFSALSLFLFSICAVHPALAKGEVAASPTNYEMIEAPTAYTLLHGGYDFVARVYDYGGVQVRGNIGIQEFFMAGFSVNATNFIGHGDIQLQTPRLALKVKALDQAYAPVALAVGWDGRGYGTEAGGRFYPGIQKGLYLAVSREFPDIGFMQLHGGINVAQFDHYDASKDLGLFGGTSFSFSPTFVVNLEADQILTDSWRFNAGVLFDLDTPLRLGMDFRDMLHGDSFSRIIRIQFISFF